jgi:hypothetical protein
MRIAEIIRWSFYKPESREPVETRQLGPFFDRETVEQHKIREEYFVYYSNGARFGLNTSCDENYGNEQFMKLHDLQPDFFIVPQEWMKSLPTFCSMNNIPSVWNFWVEVRDNTFYSNPSDSDKEVSDVDKSSPMPLHFAIASQHLDDSTPELDATLKLLPDWTIPVHWVANWQTYSFA